MTNLKILGAAVIALSALSSPVLAQAVISNPAACESEFASANCMNIGPGSPLSPQPQTRGYYQRRTVYRHPVGVAGGTAANVAATSPNWGWGGGPYYTGQGYVGGPRYTATGYTGGAWEANAYYAPSTAPSSGWYITSNGMACTSGTWVTGANGLPFRCP